jgi:digeranylgeranylglycerophospholipid reductase
MDADIIVAGAGPVGTAFAALMGEKAEVIVLEEHELIGRPVQCTGLVAPRVVEMTGTESVVINRLRHVTFHLPGGCSLDVKGDAVKAMVIDRARFDEACADQAIKKGVQIRTGEKLVDLRTTNDSVCALTKRTTGEGRYRAKMAVGADGYKSSVAGFAGLGRARSLVRGLQVDVGRRLDDQSRVHVFVGEKIAPGFFAWEIPCGDFTRVGVCVSSGHGAPSPYLKKLLAKLDMKDSRGIATSSGIIPIGPPARTYAERVMIVGDAAGQAKPLSGGGIYTGLVAARCAAETAIEALAENDFGAAIMSGYQTKWRSAIGKELDRGLVLRRAYLALKDDEIDEIGSTLSRPKVQLVLREGDIDFPSALAPKIIKAAPSLLKFAPQFLRSVVWR